MYKGYLKYLFLILLGIVFAYVDVNLRLYMGLFDFLYIDIDDSSTYLVKIMSFFIPIILSALIVAIAASGIYVYLLKGRFGYEMLLPVLSYIFIYYINGLKAQAIELIELGISIGLFVGILSLMFFLKKKKMR